MFYICFCKLYIFFICKMYVIYMIKLLYSLVLSPFMEMYGVLHANIRNLTCELELQI